MTAVPPGCLHDTDLDPTGFEHATQSFLAGIAYVDEGEFYSREPSVDRVHQIGQGGAILCVSVCDLAHDRQAQSITRDPPLAAFHLLARVVITWPSRFRGFTDWLLTITTVGAASRCSNSRTASTRTATI